MIPAPAKNITPAADIEAAWIKVKRSRIRVASSASNTRASSIGHECERFLFYERTANDKRAPHDERLQAVFDLGNLDESFVLRELEAAGVEIVQRGRDYLWREVEVSGHVDAKIRAPDWPYSLVVEIKSMSPFIWDRIQTIDDLKNAKQRWLRKYVAQLQVYLLLDGEPLGLFLLLNKSTGALKALPMALDYDYAESLLKKAERVRDAVKAGVAPDRVIAEHCDGCPFVHICLPDRKSGEGVGVIDSAELEALLERRAALKPAAKEFEQIEGEIKAMLPPKPGEVVVGEWLVKTAERQRKSYTVEAGSYLARWFVRMGTP